MKQMTPDIMRAYFMPRFKDHMKTTTKKFDVVQLATEDYYHMDATSELVDSYHKLMSLVCNELGINYDIQMISDGNDLVGRTGELVKRYNHNPNVDAVLYDFPFVRSSIYNLHDKQISTYRDIGFASRRTGSRFEDNHSVKEPHAFITDKLSEMHAITPDLMSYSIITNNIISSHNGLIPYNNLNYGKYTFVNHMHKYEKTFDSDVIVALLPHINLKRTHKIYNKKYEPMLVLDFGYSGNGEINSLDYKFFHKDTPIYNWENGLMDMYVYSLINNLLFRQ